MLNHLLHLLTLKKAFDYIVRNILLFKLMETGVRGKILNIIMSIYLNLKSRVKFDNRVCSDSTCCLGVRQGDCLCLILVHCTYMI